MFYESYYELFRVFISGLLAYVSLIIWLRVSGKRTLSKWNAFDFVVTIALGSILATVILSDKVKIAEGVLASLVLIALQFLITWLSVRVDWVEKLVKARPTLLFFEGDYRRDAMRRQRVAKGEILAAIRTSSIGSIENVMAVVLEADGRFSVIERSGSGDGNSALEDVEGFRSAA
ncbi:MAG: DUF421 domain-containing protein [Pyrinomonadaceae bacterium]|nr:DUF421 domain-containing protein [Pyrinomonadaceae bacterium]